MMDQPKPGDRLHYRGAGETQTSWGTFLRSQGRHLHRILGDDGIEVCIFWHQILSQYRPARMGPEGPHFLVCLDPEIYGESCVCWWEGDGIGYEELPPRFLRLVDWEKQRIRDCMPTVWDKILDGDRDENLEL